MEELLFEEDHSITNSTPFDENGAINFVLGNGIHLPKTETDDYWEREHDELLDWRVLCCHCRAIFDCETADAPILLTGLISTKGSSGRARLDQPNEVRESRERDIQIIDCTVSDTEQPICPQCNSGDDIVVEVEMSGSMIIPVKNGKKVNSEQYFVGDTWENTRCNKCEINIDDVDSFELEDE